MGRYWLLVVIVASLLLATPAGAQETATLSLDPAAQAVASADGAFDVRVMVDDVTTADGLGGYTLVMDYDPAVLNARGITDSGLVASTGNEVTCPASAIDNDGGRLAHFCFTIPILADPGPRLTEPEVLATVRFEPVAAGTTVLDISDSSLIDLQGDTIEVATSNGEVTVDGTGPETGGPPTDDAEGGGTTSEPSGTTLPASGNGPNDSSTPTALYIGLIAAGAAGLAMLGGLWLLRARNRAA